MVLSKFSSITYFELVVRSEADSNLGDKEGCEVIEAPARHKHLRDLTLHVFDIKRKDYDALAALLQNPDSKLNSLDIER